MRLSPSRISRVLTHHHATRYISSGTSTSVTKNSRNGVYLHAPKLKFVDGNFTADVKTWSFMESMSDAYAVLRTLEEKYGAIRDFAFKRDYELQTQYQIHMRVAFCDVQATSRMSQEGDVFHIPCQAPPEHPGGIGLADIEGLVSVKLPYERAGEHDDTIPKASEKPPIDSRLISFRVQPSRHALYAMGKKTKDRSWAYRTRQRQAQNFLQWGGFHKLEPVESWAPITDSELFDYSLLDHVRMRSCLRYYSQYYRLENPFEIKPGNQDLSETSLEAKDTSKSEQKPQLTPDEDHPTIQSSQLPSESPLDSSPTTTPFNRLDSPQSSSPPVLPPTIGNDQNVSSPPTNSDVASSAYLSQVTTLKHFNKQEDTVYQKELQEQLKAARKISRQLKGKPKKNPVVVDMPIEQKKRIKRRQPKSQEEPGVLTKVTSFLGLN